MQKPVGETNVGLQPVGRLPVVRPSQDARLIVVSNRLEWVRRDDGAKFKFAWASVETQPFGLCRGVQLIKGTSNRTRRSEGVFQQAHGIDHQERFPINPDVIRIIHIAQPLINRRRPSGGRQL